MLLLTFKSVVCSFFLVFCSCFLFCFFMLFVFFFFFFFQAEDGIRDADVTGVQTCALPILGQSTSRQRFGRSLASHRLSLARRRRLRVGDSGRTSSDSRQGRAAPSPEGEIGRASCRERV